ncbi:MAG: phage antirepressor KilAC domain-containing protein [Peptostreptococcaceae bacterium]
MKGYRGNLEYLDKLRESINLQKNILESQEQSLKTIIENMDSSSEVQCSEAVVRVGDFAEMLKSRGVPYGRNKVHSWLSNRGYTYRENDKNYAKDEYIDKGLFRVKSYIVNTKNGPIVDETIYLTSKGVKYFLEKILNEFGIGGM